MRSSGFLLDGGGWLRDPAAGSKLDWYFTTESRVQRTEAKGKTAAEEAGRRTFAFNRGS
jgi:hypothetical protein